MAHLHRFWFSLQDVPPLSALNVGCGVTAYSHDDAIQILKGRVFEKSVPACSVIEDIDISTLDENHVLPDMGVVTQRGVWFRWVINCS